MEIQMNDPKITNGEAKRLTLDDPVSPETLSYFQKIMDARAQLGLELLNLEERKITILASNKKLNEQHYRLFQGLLMERGLPPNTQAEVDAHTGKLVVVDVPVPVSNSSKMA
jgi:hypothetical protein